MTKPPQSPIAPVSSASGALDLQAEYSEHLKSLMHLCLLHFVLADQGHLELRSGWQQASSFWCISTCHEQQ